MNKTIQLFLVIALLFWINLVNALDWPIFWDWKDITNLTTDTVPWFSVADWTPLSTEMWNSLILYVSNIEKEVWPVWATWSAWPTWPTWATWPVWPTWTTWPAWADWTAVVVSSWTCWPSNLNKFKVTTSNTLWWWLDVRICRTYNRFWTKREWLEIK